MGPLVPAVPAVCRSCARGYSASSASRFWPSPSNVAIGARIQELRHLATRGGQGQLFGAVDEGPPVAACGDTRRKTSGKNPTYPPDFCPIRATIG